MASREIIALNTTTPQLLAPQTGDTYSAARAVSIAAETLTGSAATTTLNLTQTWNTTGTPTAIKLNVTDTASNASSLLADLQVGGASKSIVNKPGDIFANSFQQTSSFASGAKNGLAFPAAKEVGIYTNNTLRFVVSDNSSQPVVAIGNNVPLAFSFGDITYQYDAYLIRKSAASIQFGLADAAAPVAQTIGPQSVVAGTSNTAGTDFTIRGSQGTGTGAGGNIVFQVAPAGGSGTAQNALATAATIYNDKTMLTGAGFTVATLPAAGTKGRRAYVTDATAPTFLGTLTGGGAVTCPVFDNGTAWVAG